MGNRSTDNWTECCRTLCPYYLSANATRLADISGIEMPAARTNRREEKRKGEKVRKSGEEESKKEKKRKEEREKERKKEKKRKEEKVEKRKEKETK